jgi:SAM-dependent methyltransferase
MDVPVVEELGADSEERAIHLQVLPVVALAQGCHETGRLTRGEWHAQSVGRLKAFGGLGWGEGLGHARNLCVSALWAYTRWVESGIREVEDNVEATEAWNGPLFEVWIKYRDLTGEALRAHSDNAIGILPPAEGDRVLDIGCGLGDTTVRLAEMVGDDGSAHGVDVAERMIQTAKSEAGESGAGNLTFAVQDVETQPFDLEFDYAFSRMGTMFFANPVVALRNVRQALSGGGVLNMVVWRRKLDNDMMHRAELVVAEYLDEPEESDAPRCGPGPFSMANADTVTDVLIHAGFDDIRLTRQDLPYKIGNDLAEAVEFNMAIGPAAEVLRMWGDRIDEIRPKIQADLHEALGDFVQEDGTVVAPASTWAISARNGSKT